MEENQNFPAIRIFIGGLGESVTSNDLMNTFSSLGKVEGIEFVRTNGRSFAYMNFQPQSLKSLNKLFSMYNGCMWKGGKLKLEKAKEHYLARLKREWEGDAKTIPAEDTLSKTVEYCKPSSSSKHMNDEKIPLKIYFPKLRKLKLLPYAGSGKHKYSFQRLEAPPAPIYFCSCEEHSRSFDTLARKRNSLSVIDDGVHEHELYLMNSVMGRIFRKEGHVGVDTFETPIPPEKDHMDVLLDAGIPDDACQMPLVPAKDHVGMLPGTSDNASNNMSDSDDLVINVGHDSKEMMSQILQKLSQRTVKDQDYDTQSQKKPHKRKESKDIPATNSKKFRKLPTENSKDHSRTKDSLATCLEKNQNAGHASAQATTENEEDKNRINQSVGRASSAKGHQASKATAGCWVQTSTVKDLITGKCSSAYRLCDILQDSTPATEANTVTQEDKNDLAVTSLAKLEPSKAISKSDASYGNVSSAQEHQDLLADNNQTAESAERFTQVNASCWVNTSSVRDIITGKSNGVFRLSNILQAP